MKRYFQMENGKVKVVSENRTLRIIKLKIELLFLKVQRLFLKVQRFIISVKIYIVEKLIEMEKRR